jgi:hypothetical protein
MGNDDRVTKKECGSKLDALLDPYHVIKSIRNSGVGGNWRNQDCPSDFSMKDLLHYYFNSLFLQKMLCPKDIYPTDKQDMKSPKKLFGIADHLKSMPSPELKAIGKILGFLAFFHGLWFDKENSTEQKLEKVGEFLNYLKTWKEGYPNHFITTPAYKAILVTLESLQKFCEFYKSKTGLTVDNISFLTTLMVENFFSIIRSKIRYPNYWQYVCLYRSAHNELLKKLVGDARGYSLRDSDIGKKYNLVEGLKLDISALEEIKPSEKQAISKENLEEVPRLSDAQRDVVQTILSKYQCGEKILTIRETTCKTVHYWEQNIAFLCPFKCCPFVFFYKRSFENHLQSSHQITESDQVETKCKLAQKISFKFSDNADEDELDHQIESEPTPEMLAQLQLILQQN